jgi:ubiquinone/menaquinone biosynthesis C-methylase UbiE
MRSSPPSPARPDDYGARREYLTDAVAAGYERERYSSVLGRYRWRREQAAVRSLLATVPPGEVAAILDCPSGIGRWHQALHSLSPEVLVCGDVSPAMLRATGSPFPIAFVQSAAEELPFADGQFDLVFCHALAKHLPKPVQDAVLHDLARVSRRYVVCSLSVAHGIPGLLRGLRRARGAQTVSTSWVAEHAAAAGLRIRASRQTSTPLGTERSYVFERTYA